MNDTVPTLWGVIFLGAIAYLVLQFAWRKGFFETLRHHLVETPLSLFHVLAVFAIYFGVVSFLLSPLVVLLKRVLPPTEPLQFSVIIHLAILSITALALLLFWRTTNPLIANPIWRSTTKISSYRQDLFIGIAAWAISFPSLLFASQLLDLSIYALSHVKELPDQTAVHFLRMTMNQPLSFLFNILSIVILAPFVEELMFRGFLQTYIRKFFLPKAAITLSSICFACFHFSPEQGLGNITIIGSLFILALFLGFVYERQNSLLASISLHATFNGLSILNLYFLGGTPRWPL